MDRSTAVIVAAGLLGGAAVMRQRWEARAVRVGALAGLGPDGQPEDLPAGGLHRAVAAWVPERPATPGGRLAATLRALPLSLVGLLVSLLGGVVPRADTVRGCYVGRGAGGVPGAFLRGQGADAATIGQVVVCRTLAPSPGLLDHEAVHVRQQERLGPLFALAYPVAGVIWGYRANPFEVAARAGAGTRS